MTQLAVRKFPLKARKTTDRRADDLCKMNDPKRCRSNGDQELDKRLKEIAIRMEIRNRKPERTAARYGMY